MRPSRPSLILAVVAMVGSSGLAEAFEGTYYTHGGFIPITQAFARLNLIFSDDAYRGMFYAIITLSIFASGAINYIRGMQGGKPVPMLAWLAPPLVGAVLYLGLFSRSATIIVYDDTLNKTSQSYSSIPEGVARLATVVNTIEDRLTTIVSHPMDAGSFSTTSGGLGFAVLSGISDAARPSVDAQNSMDEYLSQCVLFEIQRPGGRLTVEDLLHPDSASTIEAVVDYEVTADYEAMHVNEAIDQNFPEWTPDWIVNWYGTSTSSALSPSPLLSALGLAASPSVFATTYLDAGGNQLTGGTETVSCTTSYERLAAYYTKKSNFEPALRDVCSSLFISENDIHLCTLAATSSYVKATGTQLDAYQFAADAALSASMYGAFANTDGAALANIRADQQMATNGVGMAVAASQWIPHAKAILTAIMLSLIPILVIFIATPLYPAAIGTIFGFFVWIACWSICDVIVHTAIMEYSTTYFQEMAQSGNMNSIDFRLAFPDGATKLLSMFGLARTCGIMLSSVITGLITKFGGDAMNMLAGNLMGTIQGAGAGAASAFNPAGRDATIRQMNETSAAMDARAKYGMYDKDMAAFAGERSLGGAMGDTAAANRTGLGLAGMAALGSQFSGRKNLASAEASNKYSYDAHLNKENINSALSNGRIEPLDGAKEAYAIAALRTYQGNTSALGKETAAKQLSKDMGISMEQSYMMLNMWDSYSKLGDAKAHGFDTNAKQFFSFVSSADQVKNFNAMAEITGKHDATTMQKAIGKVALSKEDQDTAVKNGYFGLFAGMTVKSFGRDANGQISMVDGTLNVTKENGESIASMVEELAKRRLGASDQKIAQMKNFAKDIRKHAKNGTGGAMTISGLSVDGDSGGSISYGANGKIINSISVDKSAGVDSATYFNDGYDNRRGSSYTNDMTTMKVVGADGKTHNITGSYTRKNGYVRFKSATIDGSSFGDFSFVAKGDTKDGKVIMDSRYAVKFDANKALAYSPASYEADMQAGRLPTFLLQTKDGRDIFASAMAQSFERMVTTNETDTAHSALKGGGEVKLGTPKEMPVGARISFGGGGFKERGTSVSKMSTMGYALAIVNNNGSAPPNLERLKKDSVAAYNKVQEYMRREK